jgi:hypothetical protein
MTEQVIIKHENKDEFIQAVKLNGVEAFCTKEGLDEDVYEIKFHSVATLFYLGHFFGLSVGYKITRDAFAK